MTPDLIIGLFEALGGLFILLHCVQLVKDKQVKGVSVRATGFFFAWGVWTLYYYPHLNQLLSLAGGVLIVLANCVWLGLLIYYGPWRAK